MANQHMSILIVAPIGIHVLFIESQTPRDMDLKKSAKYLGIPLALYLYLPFSAIIISTPWKWGHCQSIIGFLMHIIFHLSIHIQNYFESEKKVTKQVKLVRGIYINNKDTFEL